MRTETKTNLTAATKSRRHSGGAALLTAVFALVALIAAASLAIDVGVIWVARNQVQNASDAAALAAAAKMIDVSGGAAVVDIPTAETTANAVSGANVALDQTGVSLDPADITFGSWDLASRTFDPSVDQTDPNLITAVNVIARLDGSNNGPVPAFMSRVLGRSAFTVTSQSTAYLGFAGGDLGPGQLDLPVAIPCCKLSSTCGVGADYCASGPPVPNPCQVTNTAHQPGDTVTCLEFHSTPEQNACWTQYSGTEANINTSDLSEIVENGNPVDISVPEPMYVDNGTKTPVIGDIADRMQLEGDDIYGSTTGTKDSWVVRLPVINCQDDDQCAGGDPATLEGVVCFEIREVLVSPDKIIKGTFMCPSHPQWHKCDIGGTGGGGNFGVLADIPVLVR